MIFDSIILKLKGIMYLGYSVVSKIHLLLFIIPESCKLCAVGNVNINILIFVLAGASFNSFLLIRKCLL